MMKAKKIVKLELKNPVLWRIRKNFRDVIELAVKQESSRLYAKSSEYRKRSQESKSPVEKERLAQKKRNFRSKSNELDSLLTKSIIQCGLAGGCSSLSDEAHHRLDPKDRPTNLDMAWMPSHSAWFCTKCCEILVAGDKLLRKERHPDYMRQLKHLGLL